MRFAISMLLLIRVSNQQDSESCTEIAEEPTNGEYCSGTDTSTLGTAGACRTDDRTTASIGSGGSAAASEGKAKSQTKVNENPNQLKAQSKAQAMDQGTFSKSQTKTRVKGDELQSKTRSVSHVPGEKPVKSTTNSNVVLPRQ